MGTDGLFDLESDPRIRSAEFLISLMSLPGIGPSQALKIANNCPTLESVGEQLLKLGHELATLPGTLSIPDSDYPIRAISFFEDDYPDSLRSLSTPPAVLWIMGQMPQSLRTVAIVGTRQPSPNGQHITTVLANCLEAGSHCLVSGLADGVDALAHSQTLKNSVANISVLGSGFFEVFRGQAKSLAIEILDSGGCLISEYTPFTASTKGSFVARDRLIAAISDLCLVTECGVPSGTLHTANEAIKLDRKVLVVSSEIVNPSNLGNRLLLGLGELDLDSRQSEWVARTKLIDTVSKSSQIFPVSTLAEFRGFLTG
jgi:DNA processing protein